MCKRSRKCNDCETIACITNEATNTSACGIIKSLSPLKKSPSNAQYFDGELADTTGNIRLFGFSAPQHKKLQEYHDSKQAINISGCNINYNKHNSSLEVKVLKLQDTAIEIPFDVMPDKGLSIATLLSMTYVVKV